MLQRLGQSGSDRPVTAWPLSAPRRDAADARCDERIQQRYQAFRKLASLLYSYGGLRSPPQPLRGRGGLSWERLMMNFDDGVQASDSETMTHSVFRRVLVAV